MDYTCTCEKNKENKKPWVCPIHGMFWSKSLVIEYANGSEDVLKPNPKGRRKQWSNQE